jgi:hypothetical protein
MSCLPFFINFTCTFLITCIGSVRFVCEVNMSKCLVSSVYVFVFMVDITRYS